jgi:hypothetical protein
LFRSTTHDFDVWSFAFRAYHRWSFCWDLILFPSTVKLIYGWNLNFCHQMFLRHHSLLNSVEISFSTGSCSSQLLQRTFGCRSMKPYTSSVPAISLVVSGRCGMLLFWTEWKVNARRYFIVRPQFLHLVWMKCHFMST